jgi:hypothetical protein
MTAVIALVVTLLAASCISTSVRLMLTTRRLTKAEATLQKVVSVIALADPEQMKLLTDGVVEPKSDSDVGDLDAKIDLFSQTLQSIPAESRADGLAEIVRQNPLLNDHQFHRLLKYLPSEHRAFALRRYGALRVKGT